MKYIANPPDLLHPRLSACKNTAYSTSRFSTINYSIALPPNLGSSLIRLKLSFSFKILVSSIPTKRRISSVVKVPIGILNVFLDRAPQRSDCVVPALFDMASIRRCFRVKSMTKAQNGQTCTERQRPNPTIYPTHRHHQQPKGGYGGVGARRRRSESESHPFEAQSW